MRASIILALSLSSCASPADAQRPLPLGTVAIPDPPPVVTRPSGKPALVIENHSNVDLRLYGGWIVDEEGKLGTLALWPHPSDCPHYEPKDRNLPRGGTYELPAPTNGVDEQRCEPGTPLPPGRYVVHIDSGYGAELYATGEVTLPITEPVVLPMVRHERPPPCDARRAARAARLVLAAAKTAGASEAVLRGCDPEAAVCATLPVPEDVPPTKCAIALHESLLRVRLPPGQDTPKEVSSWLSPDVVFAGRPDTSRSTSAELSSGGKRVVFEGVTREHIHTHGGDAAKIGRMEVRVFNASGRSLNVKALRVEWLTDYGCGVPRPSGPPLAVQGYEPQVLAPGTQKLSVRFAQQDAYQAHCDVFASRVHLEVDGRPIVVTSEHRVTREEPLDLEH